MAGIHSVDVCAHITQHPYVIYRNRSTYCIYILARKYINIYIFSLNIYALYIYTYIYTHEVCENIQTKYIYIYAFVCERFRVFVRGEKEARDLEQQRLVNCVYF